jgi:hypothetical protein
MTSTFGRMQKTGYGSDKFLRACRAYEARRGAVGDGPRAAWERRWAGSLPLARYHRRLPLTELRLTTSPAGRMIAQHFSFREEDGRFRYHSAQGVLALPADFADYMRGRPRQAVRTNVGHARRAGQFTLSYAVDNWAPGLDDSRRAAIAPGPAERWMALTADGQIVAEAILSVDREVALLQGLVSFATNARWLLHTAVVERLCGECSVLLTNSDDAYRLAAGTQHFQRLLGYRISRLRVSQVPAGLTERPPEPAGLPWPTGVNSCGISTLSSSHPPAIAP